MVSSCFTSLVALAAKAGITVIARKNEKISAKTTLTAIGPTKSPAFPGNRNIGMKPRIVVKVEASNGANR